MKKTYTTQQQSTYQVSGPRLSLESALEGDESSNVTRLVYKSCVVWGFVRYP